MCRIAGIISFVPSANNKKEVGKMLQALKHGGPDDEGIYMDENVVLGNRRLSIIDLSSSGHQPMLSADEQIVVTYNGEIYNYLLLKEELQNEGFLFKTQSDTEVLIHAYACWGVSFFSRLQGIFAFSIYDKKKGKVFLVRDQIGVKPLYYFHTKKELIFASEVRAFNALTNWKWNENKNWKILFLAFGSLPYPHTTLESVFLMAPGCFLELDISTFELTSSYYAKESLPEVMIQNEQVAISCVRKAIEEALEKNMLSDAPLGIFLSGGIDSSLLTLLADNTKHTVNTVSVNFEDASVDERPFQQMVLNRSRHLEHHSYQVTEEVFWGNQEDMWKAMDQPSIDGVNSYFVSKCAKQAGLKAVLSGLGADEIFGGYESINRIKWLNIFRLMPFKNAVADFLGFFKRAALRLTFLKISGPVGDYLFLRGIFTPKKIAKLLDVREEEVWKALKSIEISVPTGLNDQEYVSFLESKIYMTNQLLKDTDYMGMWHGIEVRVPFLDIELIRKVNSISPAIRFKKDVPKFLLTAANRDLLPDEIVYRKKSGFTFPFSSWIRSNPKRFQSLLLNGSTTASVVDDFTKGKEHWSKVWSLAVISQFKA